MRFGLELWNRADLGTAEERDRLWALPGGCAKIRCYGESGAWQATAIIDYLLDIMPDCLFLLRRSADGLIDPAGQVAEARPLVEHCKFRRVRCTYILSNEDNHQDSPYRTLGIERYKRDLRALILEADSLGVALCSPPLAVMQDDLLWMGALEPTLKAHNIEYRAAHLYWQGGNYTSPDWGHRLEQYSHIVPGATWLCDEIGDSSDDATSSERAARILDVLRWLRGRGDVEAATIFIAGGTAEWARFILPAAELATIRAGLAEQEPTPTIPEVPTVPTVVIGNGLEVTDLRGRLYSSGEYPLRDLAGIRYLVAHHSGVDVDSSADSIARYHVDNQGWFGLSYAFLIHWDGRIEYCQDISRAGYTVAGRNNECLSACYVGDWTTKQPPAVMLAAGRKLFAHLQYQLGAPLPVVGHQDVAQSGYRTQCPGDTWPQWRAAVTPDGTESGDDMDEATKRAILALLDDCWGATNRQEEAAHKVLEGAARIKSQIIAIKRAAGIEP